MKNNEEHMDSNEVLFFEHYAAAQSLKIRGVTETGKWYGYGKVEVHFETVKGKDRRILLYMKKYREFIDKATNAIRR
jgi:hypothetical protein